MFSGLMLNAWEVATLVAIVGGVVGFFVVLRGSAFPAHAIPNGAFAGAAGANLIGVSPLLGLGVFSVLGALAISFISRRSRSDVATALVLVLMLALGAAFLSQSTEYEPQIFSLLFGEIVGVSSSQLLPILVLALLALGATALLFRPLLLTSLTPDIARSKGINAVIVDGAFLVVVALATTMTVPVVGALLIFTLMIGPPATARMLTNRPLYAVMTAVLLALVVVWSAIASAYATNWPMGFFVGTYSAAVFSAVYLIKRLQR